MERERELHWHHCSYWSLLCADYGKLQSEKRETKTRGSFPNRSRLTGDPCIVWGYSAAAEPLHTAVQLTREHHTCMWSWTCDPKSSGADVLLNSLQSSELQTSDPAPLHCHADGVRDHPRANGRVEVSALRRPDNRFSHWTGKNISLWTVSLCCFLKREKQNCWHKTESRLFSKLILHI